MATVAPSILAADFAHLGDACRLVSRKDNNWLHFDVMDGQFVPNISVGIPVLASLKKDLPDMCYDVHLMIAEPEKYTDAFVKAGADYITFHVEAAGNPVTIARAIRAAGAKAGISLKPGTAVETMFPLLAEVDMVLVMSVEPGFGGQSFMPEAPGRIRALREEARRQGRSLLLEVDGGIDKKTGQLCREAGVDVLVAGSTVFGAADPGRALEELMAL